MLFHIKDHSTLSYIYTIIFYISKSIIIFIKFCILLRFAKNFLLIIIPTNTLSKYIFKIQLNEVKVYYPRC